MAEQIPPWLERAQGLVGTKEIPGPENNSSILAMYADIGHSEIVDESVAWCAAFAGSCLVNSGMTVPDKAHNLMARSYLAYGRKLEAPKPGAIVVKARGKPPFGHVGIVESVADDGTMTVIAGNSSDQVKREKWKPTDPLGIRWPVEAGAKPDAWKPVVKTAAQSQSVWAQLSAMMLVVTSYVTDWLGHAFHVVLGLVTAIPALVGDAGSTVDSARTIAGWFDLPWGKIGMMAAVAGMGVALVRHIQDKRRVPWD